MSWKDVLKKDSLMKYLKLSQNPEKIKIIGIGNAGCNIVKQIYMPYKNIECEYIKEENIYENSEDIDKVAENTDIIFLVCCLGGNFGTNKLLSYVKNLVYKNIVPIIIMTTPFSFEGGRKNNFANEAIDEILSLEIKVLNRIINMDKMKLPENCTCKQAYSIADKQVILEIQNLCDLLMYD